MNQKSTQTPRRFGYQQVADAIRDGITAGEWREGEQLPNLDDMIDRFGFSRMTVFKGLQQLESKGIITMSRGRGTFVRRQIARPAVGFVTRHLLDAPGNGFSTLVARELEDRVHARGWNIRLYSDARGGVNGAAPWELLEALERSAIVGLVTVNSDLPRGFLNTPEWQDLAIPHVDLSVHAHIPHRISWDDAAVTRMIIDICETRGIQSIGTIGVPDRSKPHALAAAGLHCMDGWTVSAPQGMGMEEAGYMLIRQLWQRQRRPQALYVSDDVIAKGVVQGLLSVGASIPDDMLLIANINSGSQQFFPLPVAWIVLDTAEIAKQLMEILDALIETPGLPPLTRYIAPYLDDSRL